MKYGDSDLADNAAHVARQLAADVPAAFHQQPRYFRTDLRSLNFIDHLRAELVLFGRRNLDRLKRFLIPH